MEDTYGQKPWDFFTVMSPILNWRLSEAQFLSYSSWHNMQPS